MWLDPLALAARNLTTQDVEKIQNKKILNFPQEELRSKDVDLTIQLNKPYKDVQNFKKLPLKELTMDL